MFHYVFKAEFAYASELKSLVGLYYLLEQWAMSKFYCSILLYTTRPDSRHGKFATNLGQAYNPNIDCSAYTKCDYVRYVLTR